MLLYEFLWCWNEDGHADLLHDGIGRWDLFFNNFFDGIWNLYFLVLNYRVRSGGGGLGFFCIFVWILMNLFSTHFGISTSFITGYGIFFSIIFSTGTG